MFGADLFQLSNSANQPTNLSDIENKKYAFTEEQNYKQKIKNNKLEKYPQLYIKEEDYNPCKMVKVS